MKIEMQIEEKLKEKKRENRKLSSREHILYVTEEYKFSAPVDAVIHNRGLEAEYLRGYMDALKWVLQPS